MIKIKELSNELDIMIREKNYNLNNSTVLDYSQRLDKLIVEYMKQFII